MRKLWLALAFLGVICCGLHSQEPKTTAPTSVAVDVKLVKYVDLCAAVRAQKGKIVVVDIWGEF